MTEKEAKIIAYALQVLNSNWDEMHEDNLFDIAIDKDVKFLQRKYEGLSRPYKSGNATAYEL